MMSNFGRMASQRMIHGRWLMVLLVCLCAAATAPADQPAVKLAHPDSSDWEDLFCPDLSNAREYDGAWSFDDGVLVANKDGKLLSQQQYSDYILDFEFNNEPGANSGVFIYCSDLDNWIPSKLEIQIIDDHAEKWADLPPTGRCGAIYARLAPLKSAVRPAGQWNRMTVWCLGPKVDVMLNGVAIIALDMRAWTSAETSPDGRKLPSVYNRALAELPTRGHIGLQGRHGGAVVRFRNLKIKTITKEPQK